MKPNWTEVVGSSNVDAISYIAGDPETDLGTLYVRFRTGQEYQYFNVPNQLAEDFFTSDSKGKFFHANIMRGDFSASTYVVSDDLEPISDDDMELAQEVLDREAEGDDDLIEVAIAEEEEVEQGESIF